MPIRQEPEQQPASSAHIDPSGAHVVLPPWQTFITQEPEQQPASVMQGVPTTSHIAPVLLELVIPVPVDPPMPVPVVMPPELAVAVMPPVVTPTPLVIPPPLPPPRSWKRSQLWPARSALAKRRDRRMEPPRG
jgi:hypothetical protein